LNLLGIKPSSKLDTLGQYSNQPYHAHSLLLAQCEIGMGAFDDWEADFSAWDLLLCASKLFKQQTIPIVQASRVTGRLAEITESYLLLLFTFLVHSFTQLPLTSFNHHGSSSTHLHTPKACGPDTISQ
jgi:hypothetical protein